MSKKNIVPVKEFSKKAADEKMDLVYLETPSGFHIALDATYIEQVRDFKITLPTGETIDTADLPDELSDDKNE